MKQHLFIGSLLFAAGTTLFAQTPPAPGDQPGAQGRAPHRMMKACSEEADPAACEARRKEMREKMRAAYQQAAEACRGLEGADGRACMVQKMCAQAPDPAQCEARGKKRAEYRHAMHEKIRAAYQQAEEACKGLEGADRRACMGQKMCARAPDPAQCEARAKKRAEHRHEMREQRGARGAAPGEKS